MKNCGKPRVSWRMIILNLILPLNLLLLMFVLFVQVWYLQFDVTTGDIHAKRYLVDPLKKIFDGNPGNDAEIPSWIGLVTMEDGQIYYPYDELEKLMETWHIPVHDRLETFLSVMVNKVPSEMSIVSFTYHGRKGLVFYLDDLLPSAFKVLQKPRYLVNLFLVTTLFFLLGAGIMYNLKKNMEELIMAANRLGELDFSTPLIPKKDNELSDVFVAFEQMRKELNRTRDQGVNFMMSISHDLKTPLTSIRGYLEAMKDGVVDSEEDRKTVLNLMLNKAGLLEDRINEMLDITQDVSAHFYNMGETFSVKSWIKKLNTYCREEAYLFEKNYIYLENFQEDLQIHGVEKRLTRAVLNLFDNANRYTGQGDTIRFSVRMDAETRELVLMMDDSGPGVDPSDRERIFELFFRKDKGRNTRGMGIGLASVKFVSEIHGGSAMCRESDLGGACFELRLPVLDQNRSGS